MNCPKCERDNVELIETKQGYYSCMADIDYDTEEHTFTKEEYIELLEEENYNCEEFIKRIKKEKMEVIGEKYDIENSFKIWFKKYIAHKKRDFYYWFRHYIQRPYFWYTDKELKRKHKEDNCWKKGGHDMEYYGNEYSWEGTCTKCGYYISE